MVLIRWMVIEVNRREFLFIPLYFYLTKKLFAFKKDKNYNIVAPYTKGSDHHLGVFDTYGNKNFDIKLDARAHEILFIKEKNCILVFPRRPGTVILVIDITSGAVIKKILSPDNSHFYGHGAYSNKERLLFVTENKYKYSDERSGSIAIYDPFKNFLRVGELKSRGLGPHEIKISRSGDIFIANGGVLTNPDYPNIKLNLNDMSSNLTILCRNGNLKEQINLKKSEYSFNSIRHIDIANNGKVFAACQNYSPGNAKHTELIFSYKNKKIEFYKLPKKSLKVINKYAGSIKVNHNLRTLLVTFPKGNKLIGWELDSKKVCLNESLFDVCGIVSNNQSFFNFASNGLGSLYKVTQNETKEIYKEKVKFDNHLSLIETN